MKQAAYAGLKTRRHKNDALPCLKAQPLFRKPPCKTFGFARPAKSMILLGFSKRLKAGLSKHLMDAMNPSTQHFVKKKTGVFISLDKVLKRYRDQKPRLKSQSIFWVESKQFFR